MKKQYKALMLDLDGTTIPNDPNGIPSAKVVDAIAKASKKLHVGIVTGRPFFYAKHIMHALSLNGPSIVSGGSQIVDIATEKILWEKPISGREADAIYEIIKNFDAEFIFPRANTLGKDLVNSYVQNTEATSISIQASYEVIDEIRKELHVFKDIVFHKIPGWKKNKVWLQISHSEATKQHGIFEVAKILGIDTHEIIGVGDGGNDFPLLMACGLKVAMGNAGEDLKAIADYIAPTVDDDGVADVIEKFVL
jgi:Cof subfamily protein (haloacid dehalogenase superfamily)